MIYVEALIRQGIPGIVPARSRGSRIGTRHHGRSFGTRAVVMTHHWRSVRWLDEVEDQHSRKGDNKRGADHRRRSGVERMREGIFRNVEPPQRKVTATNPARPPKMRAGPTRTGQTLNRSVMDGPGVNPWHHSGERVQAPGILGNRGSEGPAENNPSS